MSLSGAGRALEIRQLVQALLIALTWIVLYKANAWLFASVEVNSHISWVFLPASLRIVAVMVWRGAGAAGLWMGALFTSSIWSGGMVMNELLGASISALAPVLAVIFCTKQLGLNARFEGLKSRHVLQFALIGALANSLLQNFYFYMSGIQPSFIEGILPMLIGDLLGTLVVLYGISAVLQLVSSRNR